MQCNGQCYLSKQLKKAEDAEKNTANKVLKEKEEIFSNYIADLPGIYFPAYSVAESESYNTGLYISDIETSLLKPPTV